MTTTTYYNEKKQTDRIWDLIDRRQWNVLKDMLDRAAGQNKKGGAVVSISVAVREKGIGYYPALNRNTWLLPLQWAILCDAPDEIVVRLLDLYPEATIEKVGLYYFDWVLHLALRQSCGDETVLRILQHGPEIVSQMDPNGDLPLHLALRHRRGTTLITKLISVYSDAAWIPSRRGVGELPLHTSISCRASEDVISQLLELYSDHIISEGMKIILKQRCPNNDLPLHLALTNVISTSSILSILKHYPQAVETKGNDGELPLHRALKQNACAEVVVALLCLFPKAVYVSDNDRNLPHDIIAAKQDVDRVIQGALDKPHEFWERTAKDIKLLQLGSMQLEAELTMLITSLDEEFRGSAAVGDSLSFFDGMLSNSMSFNSEMDHRLGYNKGMAVAGAMNRSPTNIGQQLDHIEKSMQNLIDRMDSIEVSFKEIFEKKEKTTDKPAFLDYLYDTLHFGAFCSRSNHSDDSDTTTTFSLCSEMQILLHQCQEYFNGVISMTDCGNGVGGGASSSSISKSKFKSPGWMIGSSSPPLNATTGTSSSKIISVIRTGDEMSENGGTTAESTSSSSQQDEQTLKISNCIDEDHINKSGQQVVIGTRRGP